MKTTIFMAACPTTKLENVTNQLVTLTAPIVSESKHVSSKLDYYMICDDDYEVKVKTSSRNLGGKWYKIESPLSRITVVIKELHEQSGDVLRYVLHLDELINALQSYVNGYKLKKALTEKEETFRLAYLNTYVAKENRKAKQKKIDELTREATIAVTKANYRVSTKYISYDHTLKNGKVTNHNYVVISSSNHRLEGYETFMQAVLIALQSAKTKRAKLTSKSVSAPVMWDIRVNALTTAYITLLRHYETFTKCDTIRVSDGKRVNSKSNYITPESLIINVSCELLQKSYDANDMVSIALKELIVRKPIKYAGIFTPYSGKLIDRQTKKVWYPIPLGERIYKAYSAVNVLINGEAKTYHEIGREASQIECDIFSYMSYINALHGDNNSPAEYVRIVVNRIVNDNFKPDEIDFLAFYGRHKSIAGKSGNGKEWGIKECAKYVKCPINRAHKALKTFGELILTNYPELLGNTTLKHESDEEIAANLKEIEIEKAIKEYAYKKQYVHGAKTLNQAYYGMFGNW